MIRIYISQLNYSIVKSKRLKYKKTLDFKINNGNKSKHGKNACKIRPLPMIHVCVNYDIEIKFLYLFILNKSQGAIKTS